MFLRSMTALTLFLAIGAASAVDTQPTVAGKQEFVAFKAQVDKDFNQDKRYTEIKPEDRQTVTQTLARMQARWQKVGDDSLSPSDRVEMANDQEIVATILDHAAADSRVVCRRAAPTGSHLPTTNCSTVAQRKRAEEKDQEMLRDSRSGGN